MRVLHVGWGFRPWRPGGLIAYAEDLMAAQVRHGHEVAYFFSGRHYPLVRGPRLKRWRRDGVALYEVVNGPIVFGGERGTRDPEHDLSDPWIDGCFDALLDELRPQVVHIQELAALPSSLIEVARGAGVPVVMTLQDYFPLCSTLRLYDSTGRVCLRRDVGKDCLATNAAAPTDAGSLVARTLHLELGRAKQSLPLLRRVNFALASPAVDAAVSRAAAVGGSLRTGARDEGPGPPPVPAGLAAAYQRRRDVNVERLRKVDLLLAQSPRLAEIYRLLGADGQNLEHMPLTLAHLEGLTVRRLSAPPQPVTFAVMDGCASPSKGAHLIVEALRLLSEAGAAAEFRLLVFGHVTPTVEAELAAHPSVELRGLFSVADLDGMLDEVDVGLVPSAWEEALGYVGLEFLAKGIPLVANRIGGIVEYAWEGETAWLNESRTGKGLGETMLDVIRHPERVVELHRSVVRQRERLIRPIGDHAREIDAVYERVLTAASELPSAPGSGR